VVVGGTGYTIELPEGFDDRAEAEMTDKGYLSGVVVEFAGSGRFEMNFIDPVRLSQDLERLAAQGTRYFTEPGLVVLPDVTLPLIQEAIAGLVRERFFDHLKPLPA
jgi:hypothetical protein